MGRKTSGAKQNQNQGQNQGQQNRNQMQTGQQSYGASGYSQGGYGQGYHPSYGQGGFRSSSQADGNWDNSGYGNGGRGMDTGEYGDGGMGGSRSQSGRGSMSTRGGNGPHAGKGPKGYQRSDERIREEVNDALTDHSEIDASNLQVEVKNGEITLTGNVDSREAKRMAEDAAESVSGVRQVINQLRVSQGSENGSEERTGSSANSGSRSRGSSTRQ